MIKSIYQLPIFPLQILVGIVINILILNNTSEIDLHLMSSEEYYKRATDIYKEEFEDKYSTVLNVLSFIGWILIIFSF